MSSETVSNADLLNFLANVSSSNPAIGQISLNSQCLVVSIDYGSQNHNHGFKTARIEIFSDITLQLDNQTLDFCCPIEDWEQCIPNRVFSLEGEKVSNLVLNEDSFQINLDNARLSALLNDTRFPEAIHIFDDNTVDAFVI